MSDEIKYYSDLREIRANTQKAKEDLIRNGKTRPNDPLNSYYDLDQEEYEEYHGGNLFQGCAVALVMTGAIVAAFWYAIEVIFD